MKKKLPSSLPLAPELLGVPTQLTSGPLTTSLEVATDFVQAVGVLPLPASAIPAAQMPSRYLKRRVLPSVLHSTGSTVTRLTSLHDINQLCPLQLHRLPRTKPKPTTPSMSTGNWVPFRHTERLSPAKERQGMPVVPRIMCPRHLQSRLA